MLNSMIMNKKALILTVFLAFFTWFGLAEPSLAITLNDSYRPDNLPTFDLDSVVATSDTNPETAATQAIIFFVGNIVSQVLLFAGAVAILFIIFSSGIYIFAFGDDTKIDKGKRGLMWSVIGLVIIMLSYAITRGVISIILKIDSAAT
jgi:hypothetical protein